MKKVLIVDDETIVRFTLRSMIDWQKLGFEVVADCINAIHALDYLKANEVDLLITDMKMPDMSGIELLRQLSQWERMPVTLVLSGYNEFDLVREAFRLGACDYILKSDLNADSMERTLTSLNENQFNELSGKIEADRYTKRQEKLEDGRYLVVLFEVDDFMKQAARFGENLEELEKPVLELARQIARVASKTKIYAVTPARYLLYYKAREAFDNQSDIVSIVKQLQSVWHDYMNLSVSAAISKEVDTQDIDKALSINELLLRIGTIYGKASICTEWENGSQAEQSELLRDTYEPLIKALYSADEIRLEQEKQAFLHQLNGMGIEDAKDIVLTVIALLAMKFREYDDDFHALFPEEVNYWEKVERLDNLRELELWLGNFLRWVVEYITNKKDNKQIDIILRAKRFITDNYANPELNLKSVADYIGFNEKYFSSRFTKESGNTFSAYLTDIRLQKAQNLMNTTDMKMYEISDRVGYNNVEHFNRMFKKTFGISPGDYKKKERKVEI